MNIKSIKKMANEHGWGFHDHQANIGLISFVKIIAGDPARINIYMTKMTVATCISHPKKGKTQLFRKNVSEKLLAKIFKNPRIHTHKGYRTT